MISGGVVSSLCFSTVGVAGVISWRVFTGWSILEFFCRFNVSKRAPLSLSTNEDTLLIAWRSPCYKNRPNYIHWPDKLAIMNIVTILMNLLIITNEYYKYTSTWSNCCKWSKRGFRRGGTGGGPVPQTNNKSYHNILLVSITFVIGTSVLV